MRGRHFALAMLVVLIWGFNFVAIKVALQGLSPMLLCCLRFFLSALPAIFFIKPPKAPIKMVFAYGFIMFALQFTVLFMGMSFGMTAGLTALILQTHVFFSIGLALLFLDENPHIWQIFGAIVAFSGIAIVGFNSGGSITIPGILLVLLAAFGWASGNLISKKLGKINMVSLVVWGSMVAWPPLLFVSLILEGPDTVLNHIQHLSLPEFGAVLYITFPSTLIAFAIWNNLLREYPVGTVAPFTLLVPIFAMLSSILILGEPLQTWKIVAGVLVISGLCLNLFGPKLFSPWNRIRASYLSSS